MQRVNNQGRWVECFASVHPIVAGGDPDGAAYDVHEAVLILVPVVGPGVPPADPLEHLSQVHVNVGELSGEDVECEQVVVVLLVGREIVSDDAHQVVDQVACVQETMVLHEDAVPYKVA